VNIGISSLPQPAECQNENAKKHEASKGKNMQERKKRSKTQVPESDWVSRETTAMSLQRQERIRRKGSAKTNKIVIKKAEGHQMPNI
jgi:hypothetical protein